MLGERLEQPPAGGVERDIDSTQPFLRRRDQRANIAFLLDIADLRERADPRGHLVERFRTTPGDHQPRALVDEALRDMLAEIAGRDAQDQRRLSAQPPHTRLLHASRYL